MSRPRQRSRRRGRLSHRRAGASSALRVGTVALVVLAAALAGCTAPGSAPGGPSAAGEPTSLADLGVDPNATWDRTAALVGTDGPPPEVRAVNASELGGPVAAPDPFLEVLVGPANLTRGVGAAATARASPRGDRDLVVVNRDRLPNATARTAETTLAHEFGHVLQYRHWPRPTAWDVHVGSLRREGVAVYLSERYEARYLARNGTETDSQAVRERGYENLTTHGRFGLAPYVYGNAWAQEALDSPAEVPDLDEELPTTSEQALHGVDEGPRLFGYDVATGDEWTESRPDPRGELGTRIVLREHLNESRATAAAEGWGYDHVSVFEDGDGRTGVVWVHRWDSPGDAEEFAAAAGTYLDRRRGETDEYRYRLERVDANTTAVVAGPSAFADAATVEGADGSVSVAVGE